MATESSRSSGSFNPAPYGRSCTGCSRANCKCFYRPDASTCERCHRLGKLCEPATSSRKRKLRESPAAPPSTTNRLEEKLDDLVSLLRSQAVDKQSQSQTQVLTPHSTPNETSTLSVASPDFDWRPSNPSTTAAEGDVTIDTSTGVFQVVPENTPSSFLPVLEDVSVHRIPDKVAEEQLAIFRRAFIPMFPFVHIPPTMSASELRYQKPFLWLVIMCFTKTSVAEQFALEETIWQIISRRIVAQHLADLDLLLGVVCFASWSHYFKKDKPHMIMLSQLAVALAFDLGLQADVPTITSRRTKSGRVLAQKAPTQRVRTLEERRTILAVFHLTSSTWISYRKSEPLRWTSYLEKCLQIVRDGTETDLDIVLATQVQCQLITNELTCSTVDDSIENSKTPSPVLISALLEKVNKLRHTSPPQIQSDRYTQFYLYHAELTILELLFNKPTLNQSNLSDYKRLQVLDSILTSIQSWQSTFFAMPLADWIGISVDNFAQFLHCLVVLFKLTTLDEPGWDLNEVRLRADVFDILDRFCAAIDQIPDMLGIVDAGGPRRGLFFKTNYLFRAIKALFLAETQPGMRPQAVQEPQAGDGEQNTNSNEFRDDFMVDDEFLWSLTSEPWLSDIFGSSQDLGFESSLDPAFAI